MLGILLADIVDATDTELLADGQTDELDDSKGDALNDCIKLCVSATV